MVVFLKWDSEFFGFNIGKLISNKKEESYDFPIDYKLVYQFSDLEILELDRMLVDRKCVLTTELNEVDFEENIDLEILDYDSLKHNYSALYSLVLQSGEYSRFKRDTNFSSESYERLYKEWLNRSLSKELASDVLVATIDNQVVGFITMFEKTSELADLTLLAVDLQYRGRNIASNLIKKLKQVAKLKGYKMMQVVTQLDNKPAMNLYQKNLFEISNITYIYHIWKNDTI